MPRKAASESNAKTSRLKVFQAQFGFYDSIVAAPSQPAALRAWGTHQNLFADGQARVAEDRAAVEAALAHPNVPLRRALGSTGAFEVEPTTLPVVPDLPRRAPGKRASETPQAEARQRAPADRSKLDAAERDLSALEARRARERRLLEQRRSDLEAETAEADRRHQERRRSADAAVAAAREAYRKAGGTD